MLRVNLTNLFKESSRACWEQYLRACRPWNPWNPLNVAFSALCSCSAHPFFLPLFSPTQTLLLQRTPVEKPTSEWFILGGIWENTRKRWAPVVVWERRLSLQLSCPYPIAIANTVVAGNTHTRLQSWNPCMLLSSYWLKETGSSKCNILLWLMF